MVKFYNTLSRKKEVFKPLEDNTVRMYTCGPTVYDYAHIGNFRAYIFMDTLRRVLKYNKFIIDGVMNITDVGHLVSDADDGEDKMIKAANRENKSPYEIAGYYTDFFMKDAKKLNIGMPEHIVKATDHIKDMITFIEGIIKNGYGYEVDGNVYFDVEKYGNYGILSGINLKEQKAGARVEINEQKRSPCDFALWIKAPENHIMKWKSPWGIGYPGWHIECSAMGKKYLGEVFDIHTGGVDHIPVHHENEIAQSVGLTGKTQAKFWMHVEFLQINSGKMSKSLGNCYRIEQLESMGYSPLDYRYFCLNANYNKQLNFTFDALSGAKIARERLNELVIAHKTGANSVSEGELAPYMNKFESAINDDLNIPLALGELWSMLKTFKPSKDVYEMAIKMDSVFGLSLEKLTETKKKEVKDIPVEIKDLAEKRWEFKKIGNYKEADELRKTLTKMGYNIVDSKENYEIKKI